MRIMLVANKFLPRSGKMRIDNAYWNVYIPLVEMGHEVRFYDTYFGEEKSFESIVEDFKPELIFSILTFNKNFVKFEPIEQIKSITKKGNIKTFNWFCDDTWRFKTLSSKVCWDFTACSTPEPDYIHRYKEIGYTNILLGCWHTNSDFSFQNSHKTFDVSFCGHQNSQRSTIFGSLGALANVFSNLSQEDMMLNYSMSKVGLNLSINENDPERKTQMKLRMVEIPSTKSVLLTEYTPGLEHLFEEDKEIVTFSSEGEMKEKMKALLKHNSLREKIAAAGYERFLKEHESKVRLTKLLSEIASL
jgi:spore maturation protein CgeB